MSARVVVFLDWQNVYRGAREAFCTWNAPHWEGQVDPLALAQHLADDSPYDRQLHQVRIYRGQPVNKHDPQGYAASRRQHAVWTRSPLVELVTRSLAYPPGWPNRTGGRERPEEKGIDVALALDFALMGIHKDYDVGILMSSDTDLKPALEAVAALTDTQGTRAEVAALSTPGRQRRRLRLFSGARSSGISFNMLHRTDKQRVKQQYICPAENVVVDRSEIVKGYEFRKDEYIVIEPDEIKKIEPQTAKTMEILEFVKESQVDPVYFE